ncbi:HTH domain-containing protein [Natronomonas gomsonensis]|uniref:HTH domain-containing protein n=1 Tax=Natronomonas gomsonensis TaxID=1046043 RepID=UPI0015BF341B|nr:HTH domain-containing protein [Natronomonas gomsonensis]
MLRGLDMGGKSGGEPTIIRVADREPLSAELTLYVHETVPDAASDRVSSALDGFELLEQAGVVTDRRVETVSRQPTGNEADGSAPAAVYDEFVEAVDWESLDPFFKTRPGSDGADRVTFPPLCVAIRDAGELTGLYPRWNDGTHESIEDCLNALAAGDRVENVRP